MPVGTRVSVLLTDGDARVATRHAGEPGLNRQFDACGDAPVRDPLFGRIRCVIDLTCRHDDATALMAALAAEAAAAIERRLVDQYSRPERVVLDAFVRGRVPGRLPDLLRPPDLERVRYRVAGLVAEARPAVVGVSLSDGGRAVLLPMPVPMPDPAGGEGVGVVGVAAKVRPASWSASAAVAVPGSGSERRDRQYVLGGETGLGRIASTARRRLSVLWEAGSRIGTTLDIVRTAEELTEVVCPELAQYAAVDLAEWVLDGSASAPDLPLLLRRSAVLTIRDGGPLVAVGECVRYEEESVQARCLAEKRPIIESDLTEGVAGEPGIGGYRMGSVLAVPILARGTVLGVATFYRSRDAHRFTEDDWLLAEQLVLRVAICLDNARRFAREHATALTLQRSLLSRVPAVQYAVDVAHRYFPAQEDVGGDWFDVIPLSGGRVALVVGDVVGHGIHAAATMGRLRTAVRSFSALDLPAEDLLGHLDAFVDALDQEESDDRYGDGVIGATCLYVVYDPVALTCTMAAAGHPPPAVVAPDGTVYFPPVPTGPPLGLGGTSFETLELPLPEGSRIVLYTDGLVEHRDQDIDVGLERLAAAVAIRAGTPDELCETVVRELLPHRPRDDVALLVARTRRTASDRVATWDVPMEPSAVAGLRAAVTARLAVWGLHEAAFTTELIVSELVTNAIRHASGPLELRLLRDRALICEVADGSSVSPRLRHATANDEGGRGLFLVARLAQRWGTRYTSRGKVIWAEQPLPVRVPAPAGEQARGQTQQ